MALVFATGFDSTRNRGPIQELFGNSSGSGWTNDAITFSANLNIFPVPGYLGGWAAASGGSIAGGVNVRSSNSFLSDTKVWMGFWFKVSFSPPTSGGNVDSRTWVGLGTGTRMLCGINFQSFAGTGGCNLRWAYTTDTDGNFSYVDFDEHTIEDQTWHHVEMLVDSGVEYVEVRLDGITVFISTTSEHIGDISNPTFDRFGWASALLGSTFLTQNDYFAIDNLIVWDDNGTGTWTNWVGPRVVEDLDPAGDYQSDFSPFGGPAMNYACVDDGVQGTFNDSDYVESLQESGQLDLYTHEIPKFLRGQVDGTYLIHRIYTESPVTDRLVVAYESTALQINEVASDSGITTYRERMYSDPLNEDLKLDHDKLRNYKWGIGDYEAYVYADEPETEPPVDDEELLLDYGTVSEPTGTPQDFGTVNSPSGDAIDLGGV